MRVLHLSAEFPPLVYGGLGMALGGLATASARAGMAVAVLLVMDSGLPGYGQALSVEEVARDRATAEQAIVPGRVALFHTPASGAVETALRLVRAWRPDVIHLHPVELWPLAREIRRQTGLPLVYTVHSLNQCEYRIGNAPGCVPLWKMQEELIAAADRVIALTGDERALLFEHCPAAGEKVRIIGNGIDDCAAALEAAACGKQRAGPPLVLYTGRFVERKGIRELLDAIPRVLERAPATRFVLAGGWRHSSAADMERDWLPPGFDPYRPHVHFTGWLDAGEVAAWYRAADVLVVPSWYEPFGMVILEGMLHGLAIAASDVGGPAAILEQERTGLLFPAKNSASLAEAILRLVADAALRRRLGGAAAAEVRRAWLWPHIVQKMEAIYEEAVAVQ